jgi:DNA helicase-2/ATP-dependent DNA helicase PcrA
MVAAGLPYRIIGSKRFFERMEIKDLMAYLLLIASDAEDDSFARIINVPPRGFGERSLEKLQAKAHASGASMMAMLRRSGRRGQPPSRKSKAGMWLMAMERLRAAAQDNMGMADLLKAIIAAIDYDKHLKTHFEASADDRLENVAELVRLAGEFDHNFDRGFYRPAPGEEAEARVAAAPAGAEAEAEQLSCHSRLALFLAEAAVMLNFDADDKTKKRQAVTICTIHAAKGLEWTAVFIPCCSEDQLPFYYALLNSNRASLAEERRLLYVGMTRAKYFLQLGHCTTRLRNGQTEICMPSRFVTGLRLRMQSHSNEELRSFRPVLGAMSRDAGDLMEERTYDAVLRAEESMRSKWKQVCRGGGWGWGM